ncbi:MAG: aspartate ammonia-lyase [Deltaproteobacteria bacterium CG_4_8_14_3_um_filter_45_9]|nr:MAG: aspartate ammonia-lyase [Deltaproteobacteria bacterium CG03_land_8_20_14_0_80_45_14]PIX21937.1 MAG: aspartate ammonia-lyase [Deltaproteobacteria bacterium CG_4_8_14_3_um_filter_45_9]
MIPSKNLYRIERDSMGPVKVPKQVYYGAQTQRAIENFPISGWRFGRELLYALGLIKYASAKTNFELGLLQKKIARAIEQASQEVMEGRWDEQFVVDIFQTGSGTSTNMNANEVIANRANEILGSKRGAYRPVHPNDHVNLGQSSNDVFPSAIHIASVALLQEKLLPAMRDLHDALKDKGKEFHSILKIGRTHLQDATPIRLGQEFGGYARQVELGIHRIQNAMKSLSELPLGGTAVGTGINTHPSFAMKAIAMMNKKIGYRFSEAVDHFEAQGAKDALVEMSGTLKTVAAGLIKIANDIRWLGSGPRCGIGEIRLQDTQPGSSIMPGKVNPVIPESLIQVGAQVIGNDSTITLAGLSGNFELNVMMPLIAYNLLQSIHLLGNAVNNFSKRCIQGLNADRQRCEEMVEKSLALATALTPKIGYEEAARIAKKAYVQNKTIRKVVEEECLFPSEELKRLLDPQSMIAPVKPTKKKK